ncbi:MAG: hypothetical protein ACREN7_00310 [Candidatus Dormibacteria bacterium]
MSEPKRTYSMQARCFNCGRSTVLHFPRGEAVPQSPLLLGPCPTCGVEALKVTGPTGSQAQPDPGLNWSPWPPGQPHEDPY